MNNFKLGRHRDFVAYRPLTEDDKAHWAERGKELTHLKIRVEYSEGGQNYFSGGYNKRGFRVSVTPVTLSEERGYTSESFVMLGDRRNCGGYVMIEEAKRYNSKRLEQLAEKYDGKVEDVARAVILDDVHVLVQLIQGNNPPPKTPDPAPAPQAKTMWSEPTEKQLSAIPAMYSTENVPLKDKVIHMHFFLGGSDWYVAEYDPKERMFFGFVILNNDLECAEWGPFSYDELKTLRAGFVQMDRDRHWTIRPAGEVDNIVKAQRWQFQPGVPK
ncbi:MAG: hypothetical protein WC750_06125 [Patescibacteria group bacterium]